jgi:hypothetical protein
MEIIFSEGEKWTEGAIHRSQGGMSGRGIIAIVSPGSVDGHVISRPALRFNGPLAGKKP